MAWSAKMRNTAGAGGLLSVSDWLVDTKGKISILFICIFYRGTELYLEGHVVLRTELKDNPSTLVLWVSCERGYDSVYEHTKECHLCPHETSSRKKIHFAMAKRPKSKS